MNYMMLVMIIIVIEVSSVEETLSLEIFVLELIPLEKFVSEIFLCEFEFEEALSLLRPRLNISGCRGA